MSDSSPKTDPSMTLAGGWLPANRAMLADAIAAWAGRAPQAAVFDWDNTCIFNDIGDATFRYQLERLAFRLQPAELADLLPRQIGAIDTLVGGLDLLALRADILRAYTALWPLIQSGKLIEARRQHAYFDLRAKLGHMYQALDRTPGVGAQFTYPWLACLFSGFSPEEIHVFAVRAWVFASRELVGAAAWHSATPGDAGFLDYSFRTHVAPHPEIAELMEALQAAKVDIYVVSASLQAVVEGAVRYLQFPVPAENVFGMRVEEAGGALTHRRMDPEQYPVTYRAGKVELINKFLPRAPVLVAGDANTDYEMLTAFTETEVRLVINRNGAGDIRRLYDLALGDATSSPPRTLLQGRDENVGAFRPSHETVALGAIAPTPLG